VGCIHLINPEVDLLVRKPKILGDTEKIQGELVRHAVLIHDRVYRTGPALGMHHGLKLGHVRVLGDLLGPTGESLTAHLIAEALSLGGTHDHGDPASLSAMGFDNQQISSEVCI
jgi:hypothetical protein